MDQFILDNDDNKALVELNTRSPPNETAMNQLSSSRGNSPPKEPALPEYSTTMMQTMLSNRQVQSQGNVKTVKPFRL